MPEATMEQYLLHAATVAPTLAESHRRTLVQTNPLAAWADERLTLDPAPGKAVPAAYRPASVKVGVAVLDAERYRYEHEDVWLYPNYVAYCKSTNNKPLSLRRFTNLLIDLLLSQLHLTTVEQKTLKTGSHIRGIRFRRLSDDTNVSIDPDTHIPEVPFLITGTPPAPPKPPSGTPHPSPGEGSEAAGEGWGEGLNGVGYGSEGSEADLTRMYREGESNSNAHHEASTDNTHTDGLARAYKGCKTSLTTLTSITGAG
jgi:hypothetical protein